MRRGVPILLSGLVLLIAILAVPFLLRDPPAGRVAGPALAELDYTEVSFPNGELGLAGMVFLPSGDGPHPAAVIIHGSGTSRRDNPSYLSVAAELQSNGIAVLLPDKRGSEGSGDDWRDTTLEELATDTEAALDRLARLPGIDPDHTGVIGMSQGGWIAPIVATRRPEVAFVVSMSGAGVTTEEQLLFEEINNIVQMGTYRAVARLIAPFTVRGIQQRDSWRALAGFDPIPWWRELEAPAFAAFGEGDTNVPVAESVARLAALPGKLLIRIYPGGGHGITDPESRRVQRVFLNDLVAFIGSDGARLATE
jgi:dipeptidyl aminopeptidase/acylaminoacyl peptidase